MSKKLYKIEKDKKIFGVCAGIAEYLNMDPTIVRVAWVLFTLCICGAGILIYIICAFIFPDKTEVENQDKLDSNNNVE